MPPSVAYDKVMLSDDSGVAELTAKIVNSPSSLLVSTLLTDGTERTRLCLRRRHPVRRPRGHSTAPRTDCIYQADALRRVLRLHP
jgi:hypothetical protein